MRGRVTHLTHQAQFPPTMSLPQRAGPPRDLELQPQESKEGPVSLGAHPRQQHQLMPQNRMQRDAVGSRLLGSPRSPPPSPRPRFLGSD